METLNQVVDYVLNLFRDGFYEVNGVQGIVIAVIAAIIMKSWTRVIPIALGATLAHILVSMLIPVITGSGSLHLPPIVEQSFWVFVLTLFVGYIIVILVLFMLKSVLFKGG